MRTFPSKLIGLFTENADTIAIGKTALRLICIGFVISAVSVTSSGALEGLGMGIPSLMISLCRFIAIILPLAFFLCKLTGPTGVWNAFLDNRSRHRFDICIYLQIFSFKAKRFKINTVAIPQLPFISV